MDGNLNETKEMAEDRNSFIGGTLLFLETLISNSPVNGEVSRDIATEQGGDHTIIIKCVGDTTAWNIEVNVKEIQKVEN